MYRCCLLVGLRRFFHPGNSLQFSKPTTPQNNEAPRTTNSTWHTSPHHTITYSTTSSPYHDTHQRRGTAHNQHTLNTTTTRSSTIRRPHYTGPRHTSHGTPPWTRGEPRTHTTNTKA